MLQTLESAFASTNRDHALNFSERGMDHRQQFALSQYDARKDCAQGFNIRIAKRMFVGSMPLRAPRTSTGPFQQTIFTQGLAKNRHPAWF
jgi:hypothetical protein